MTAPIIQCPHCQAKMKPKTAPEAGKRVQCPRCRETFTCEEGLPSGVARPTASRPPAQARRPTVEPEDEVDDERVEPTESEPEDEVDDDQADATDSEPPDDARPEKRRKKKKRAKKKKEAAPSRKGLYIGLGVLGVLVLGSLGFLIVKMMAGRGDEVIVAKPTVEYQDRQGMFSCSYPEGWKVEAFGEKPYRNVTFSSGSAYINVRTSAAVSTVEDAAVTGRPKMLTDPRGATIDAHAVEKPTAVDQVGSGYEEEGEVEFMMGMIPRSKFVVKGGWFSKPKRGYRMTILAFPKRISVICLCNETDWARLEPVFAAALASVRPGA